MAEKAKRRTPKKRSVKRRSRSIRRQRRSIKRRSVKRRSVKRQSRSIRRRSVKRATYPRLRRRRSAHPWGGVRRLGYNAGDGSFTQVVRRSRGGRSRGGGGGSVSIVTPPHSPTASRTTAGGRVSRHTRSRRSRGGGGGSVSIVTPPHSIRDLTTPPRTARRRGRITRGLYVERAVTPSRPILWLGATAPPSQSQLSRRGYQRLKKNLHKRAKSVLRNPSDFLTPQELEDMKILVWERVRERVIRENIPGGRPDEGHLEEINLLVRAIQKSEPDYRLPTFVVYGSGDSDNYDFSF